MVNDEINDSLLPTITPIQSDSRLPDDNSYTNEVKENVDEDSSNVKNNSNERMQHEIDTSPQNENETIVVDGIKNISEPETIIRPAENDNLLNGDDNIGLIPTDGSHIKNKTTIGSEKTLDIINNEAIRTDETNSHKNLKNSLDTDNSSSISYDENVIDKPQCKHDDDTIDKTFPNHICSETVDKDFDEKPITQLNHQDKDQKDIEFESNNQLHPDTSEHKLESFDSHKNKKDISLKTNFSANGILEENTSSPSFSIDRTPSQSSSSLEKEKENIDMNVVNVKISHQRHGSNVSIASLSERCKEIKGEAIEHNVDRASPPDMIAGDDTLEGNLHPCQRELSVISPQHHHRHSDDSDDDGILYPMNPFPPPTQTQVTSSSPSIYSQKRVSLSEYSLSQDEALLEDAEDDERLLESMMEYDRIDVQNDLIESLDSITDVEDNDGTSDGDLNNADSPGEVNELTCYMYVWEKILCCVYYCSVCTYHDNGSLSSVHYYFSFFHFISYFRTYLIFSFIFELNFHSSPLF